MHTRVYADTLLYNQEAYERWQSLPGDHIAPQLYIDGHQHPGWYYQWEDSIVERMTHDAPVAITMDGSFDPGNGQGTVSATYRNDSTASINGRVLFVVIEDSVYFMDSLAGQMKEWHNHTARDYLPGPLGMMVTIAPGDSVMYTQPFTIPAEWRYEYCKIVTFLQDTVLSPDTLTQNIWQGALIEITSLIGIREDDERTSAPEPIVPSVVNGPIRLDIGVRYRILDVSGREVRICDPAPGIYFIAIPGKGLHKIIKIR